MKLIDYENPNSFSSRLRRRRIRYFCQLVRNVIETEGLGKVSIIDVGGTTTYWNIFPFEKFRNVGFRITVVNLEPVKGKGPTSHDNVRFDVQRGNACDLSKIQDKMFDFSHSNSLIEHVGGWENVHAVANEIKRVARFFYLQTPNYYFPVEPHFLLPFFQYLPRPMRGVLLEWKYHVNMEQATMMEERIRLLTPREIKQLFPESEIFIERFLGLPKSIIARSRFAGRT